MGKLDPARDPRNAPGRYYVEKDCCLLCGVPWHYAPGLFNYDKDGCWVQRQPANETEEGELLKVIEIQELGCIRRDG
jgi:ferredoxin